jgi:hypothetical protein
MYARDPHLAHDDRTALPGSSIFCSVRIHRRPVVEVMQKTGLEIIGGDNASVDREQPFDSRTSEPNICEDVACA